MIASWRDYDCELLHLRFDPTDHFVLYKMTLRKARIMFNIVSGG